MNGVNGAAAGAHLVFAVTGVRPVRFAAVPTLAFRLAVGRDGGGPVRSVLLATAIRIAPARRRHDRATRERLADVFGAPERWAATLRPLAWTQVTTVVPPFDGRTEVDLAVPCPCDVEAAVAKYLRALPDGDVPLDFQFSGTVFHTGADGALRTAQISWNAEAAFALPAAVWREAIRGDAWIRLGPDTRDRLDDYRARHALGGWDEAVRALLAGPGPATGAPPSAPTASRPAGAGRSAGPAGPAGTPAETAGARARWTP